MDMITAKSRDMHTNGELTPNLHAPSALAMIGGGGLGGNCIRGIGMKESDETFFDSLSKTIASAPKNLSGSKEYKVISSLDSLLSGRFDAGQIEDKLNAFAAAGWRVIAVCSAPRTSISGSQDELLAFLERDR